MVIRPYTDEDREVLAAVYRSAMSSEPWFEDVPEKAIFKRIADDFIRCSSQQFVGVLDDSICAVMWWDEMDFVSLSEERGAAIAKYWKKAANKSKTIWFRDLLVAGEYQGKGIGTKMVDFAIQEWRRQNYRFALLRILLGGTSSEIFPNTKAIKLYEKKGFSLIPKIRHITQLHHNEDYPEVKMGYMFKYL